MSSWESLGISLKLINMCGLHPQKVKKPLFVFNFAVLVIIPGLIVTNMVLNFHLSLLEAISYHYYVWSKFGALLVLQRLSVAKMLETIKHFKPIDDCFSEENVIYKKYDRMLKFYAYYVLMCLFLVTCNTFTLDTWTIFESYVPKGVPNAVLFFAEFYAAIVAYLSTVGTNILTCTFTLCVAQQFGILKKKIQTLDLTRLETEDDRRLCVEKLKEIIAFHIFLLKCIKQLRDMYSFPLLMQLGGDVYLLCIHTYGITSVELRVMDLIRHVAFNLLIITSFIFLFGYPSQLLMEESEGVGESIYCNCEWYAPNIVPIRRNLRLMVLMSQQNLTITAGGFADVNNTTVLFLIKTAYSFYTYLQTVS
nr:odorant receptor [Semanotus bifasciatus]